MNLENKRVAAFDFGLKRIGVAVCDEMHIVVSTRPIIENNPLTKWQEIQHRLALDRIEIVLVGVPRKHDNSTSAIIEACEAFITEFRTKVNIPVFEVDESFSTQEARSLMIQNGTKKSKRSAKGTKDQVAAAIILRTALDEFRFQKPL